MSIVEYVENVLGINLWPYQKQILEALEKAPSDSRLMLIPGRKAFFLTEKKS